MMVEVYVNGKKQEIYRANYTFRAVKIDKGGDHIVEFVYRPRSFRIGILGSFATFMTLIGYSIWKRRHSS